MLEGEVRGELKLGELIDFCTRVSLGLFELRGLVALQ